MGVPDIVALVRVIPGGSEELAAPAQLHLYGAIPPVAVRGNPVAPPYSAPLVPEGSGPEVISKGKGDEGGKR